jgi:DNA-directed RNA polymerase specialized sigma24 family protein
MLDARRAYPSGLSYDEDVCQDAFAAVLARLTAYRPAARFRA